MDETEVTNLQFKEFVEVTGYITAIWKEGGITPLFIFHTQMQMLT
ncbi:formylglycine-generating enzyme family protein [Sporocytophaga myxococcoides]|nr:formylglycine-generating enzyme family protein [Sporocytophaga myxococcoides]